MDREYKIAKRRCWDECLEFYKEQTKEWIEERWIKIKKILDGNDWNRKYLKTNKIKRQLPTILRVELLVMC